MSNDDIEQKLQTTAMEISKVCNDLAEFLIEKNKAYGDSALSPVRIFSKASSEEQILVRLDDKLSRLARGHAMGEDVFKDAMGYLVLWEVLRRRTSRASAAPAERQLVGMGDGARVVVTSLPTAVVAPLNGGPHYTDRQGHVWRRVPESLAVRSGEVTLMPGDDGYVEVAAALGI